MEKRGPKGGVSSKKGYLREKWKLFGEETNQLLCLRKLENIPGGVRCEWDRNKRPQQYI